MKTSQQGVEIYNKMCSFEVSIGCCPSFGLSHQMNSCYGSLTKISQQGAEIFNNMCSFEVSIG